MLFLLFVSCCFDVCLFAALFDCVLDVLMCCFGAFDIDCVFAVAFALAFDVVCDGAFAFAFDFDFDADLVFVFEFAFHSDAGFDIEFAMLVLMSLSLLL